MNPIRMICKFKIKNADVCMYLFFFIFFMQRVFLCYFTLIYSRVSMHSLYFVCVDEICIRMHIFFRESDICAKYLIFIC